MAGSPAAYDWISLPAPQRFASLHSGFSERKIVLVCPLLCIAPCTCRYLVCRRPCPVCLRCHGRQPCRQTFAMARKVIARIKTRAGRQQARGALGTLLDLKNPPGITKRYTAAIQRFLLWQADGRITISDYFGLEEKLCSFIEKVWNEGDPRSWVGDLLSGLSKFQPSLRGHYRLAWNLLDTWRKHELADRATPLDLDFTLAMAGYAICK